MDQVKSNDNIAALKHSMKSQYLTKITQLLVSISLCSFLYSPSSLLAFLQCFNFYFSTIPLQLFTHTIDKNCMFLLCNGLLVFLGITRTFSGSSAENNEQSKYRIEDVSESQSLEIEISQPLLEEAEVMMASEVDEQKYAAEEAAKIKYLIKDEEDDVEKAIVEDEEQGKKTSLEDDQESAVLDQENAEEGNIEQETGDQFVIEESLEEEEEEEVEEENWTITTEEMNKKFDDFIKRMKADLRIEAQRRLVMV